MLWATVVRVGRRAVYMPRRSGIMADMARPERRIVLAGESPVRVSAGAPGSRLQPGGEIRPSRAECRKPLKERGANQRAATNSERSSLVRLSAERCLEGRAAYVTAQSVR